MPNPNWSPEVLHAQTLFADDVESVALITLNGANTPIVNKGSDMRYEVVAGGGIFYIADQAVQLVQAGSIIDIPAGTPYCDEGSMLLLATARPPFDPEQVIFINF